MPTARAGGQAGARGDQRVPPVYASFERFLLAFSAFGAGCAGSLRAVSASTTRSDMSREGSRRAGVSFGTAMRGALEGRLVLSIGWSRAVRLPGPRAGGGGDRTGGAAQRL